MDAVSYAERLPLAVFGRRINAPARGSGRADFPVATLRHEGR